MSFGPQYNPGGNDGDGGFYVPRSRPYEVEQNYQEFLNSTSGVLDFQDMDALHDLISELPMLKLENLQLAGETCVWLRRLRSGLVCPHFNESSQSCEQSKCDICFNTGIIGGYGPGVELKISFIPGKADVKIQEVGLTIQQRPQAWTVITNPVISEQDIIIVFENQRYEVGAAEAIELQGHRYYQELTLSWIDRNDVKYYVPSPSTTAEVQIDFVASLFIRGPHADFAATMRINNLFFENIPPPLFNNIIFPANQANDE